MCMYVYKQLKQWEEKKSMLCNKILCKKINMKSDLLYNKDFLITVFLNKGDYWWYFKIKEQLFQIRILTLDI